MNRTVLGLALIALGVALAIVSGFAHLIGLSFTASDAATDTFGAKQAAGLAVGVAVAVIGLVVTLRTRGHRGAGPTGSGPGEGRGG